MGDVAMDAKELHRIRQDDAKYISVRNLSLDRRLLLYAYDALKHQLEEERIEVSKWKHDWNNQAVEIAALQSQLAEKELENVRLKQEWQWQVNNGVKLAEERDRALSPLSLEQRHHENIQNWLDGLSETILGKRDGKLADMLTAVMKLQADHGEAVLKVIALESEQATLVEACEVTIPAIEALEGTPIEYRHGVALGLALKKLKAAIAGV